MDQRARERRGVACGRIVLGVGHAGGVGKVRSGQAELLRVGVHHLHEGLLRAADLLGQRDRRVVARLHDHALQQVVDGHLLADLDEHARALLLPGALADRDRVGELEAAFVERLEDGVGRHQLGQTGRLLARVGLTRGEHATAVVVDHDEAARVQLRRRRNGGRGGGHGLSSLGRHGRACVRRRCVVRATALECEAEAGGERQREECVLETHCCVFLEPCRKFHGRIMTKQAPPANSPETPSEPEHRRRRPRRRWPARGR